MAGFITEVVMTAFFLIIILGATDGRAPAGFAPIAIGFGLVLIHLISIPVTNTSVNPARSTAVAIFAGGAAIQQLWLFWVAPIVGGLLGAVVHKYLESFQEEPNIEGDPIVEVIFPWRSHCLASHSPPIFPVSLHCGNRESFLGVD